MRIFRKLVLTAAAGFLTAGLAGMTTPAAAVDSSWGCGGLCVTGPVAGM